jgi:serine/threonine-protein kinase RsbW
VARPLRVVTRRRAGALEFDVPSALALVGEAVELIARHCATGVLSPRRLQFNLRTALAEALTNAITYGNGEDPAKLVRVTAELTADALRIVVRDDGGGFDAERVPDPTAPENLEREDGRGLFVMRHLADHVTFNRKGNEICLLWKAG